MPRPAAFRQLTIGWALVAFLVASLAPWLCAALSEQVFDPQQVCTSAGHADRAAPVSGDHRHLLEHCPFCAHHAGSTALPPTTGLALAGTALPRDVPYLFLAAPATPFAWAAGQPRAPPAAA